MENRRSFFKGLAAFASGVVGAKVASYIPKKEEPKEEILVSSALTITQDGESYHPLIIKKTDADRMIAQKAKNQFDTITEYRPTLRKANV